MVLDTVCARKAIQSELLELPPQTALGVRCLSQRGRAATLDENGESSQQTEGSCDAAPADLCSCSDETQGTNLIWTRSARTRVSGHFIAHAMNDTAQNKRRGRGESGERALFQTLNVDAEGEAIQLRNS